MLDICWAPMLGALSILFEELSDGEICSTTNLVLPCYMVLLHGLTSLHDDDTHDQVTKQKENSYLAMPVMELFVQPCHDGETPGQACHSQHELSNDCGLLSLDSG